MNEILQTQFVWLYNKYIYYRCSVGNTICLYNKNLSAVWETQFFVCTTTNLLSMQCALTHCNFCILEFGVHCNFMFVDVTTTNIVSCCNRFIFNLYSSFFFPWCPCLCIGIEFSSHRLLPFVVTITVCLSLIFRCHGQFWRWLVPGPTNKKNKRT